MTKQTTITFGDAVKAHSNVGAHEVIEQDQCVDDKSAEVVLCCLSEGDLKGKFAVYVMHSEDAIEVANKSNIELRDEQNVELKVKNYDPDFQPVKRNQEVITKGVDETLARSIYSALTH